MKDLTKGNIYKTFFTFGFPLCLSALLTQIYSFIDTIMAGQYLGETALGAIGATAPLVTILSSIFWGAYSGYSIYIARLFGSGDYKKLKQTAISTLLVFSLVCLLIALTTVALCEPIFDLLNIDQKLRAEAKEYYIVYTLGLFMITLGCGLSSTFHALGVSSFVLLFSIVSSVINIVGNYLSIIVFNWGLIGVAGSSVLSALVVNLAYVIKLKKCFTELGVTEKISISLNSVKDTFGYSLPNSFQQISMYIGTLLLSPLINKLGVEASASYLVCLKICNLCQDVYVGAAKSISSYSSQCLGHNEPEKLKKGLWVGILYNVIYVTPFVLVCIIFYKFVCGLFLTESATPLTIQYSHEFVKYYLPFLYFHLLTNAFHAFFRGVKAMGHLYFTTTFATVMRYVLSLILINKLAYAGFYIGWVSSWVLEVMLIFFLYKLGKWKPKLKTA